MRLLLLSLLLPTVVSAQTSSVAAQLRAPWEAQQRKAEAMRDEASRIRDAASLRREHEEYACNGRILYYRCMDGARDNYLEQVNRARAMEADAHRLDSEAKRQLLAIRDAQLTGSPLPPPGGSGPAVAPELRQPRPTAQPLPPPTPIVQPKPTGTPAAERAAEDAARQVRQQEREREAAERAAKAREDAARYDARMREVEQKKAQRASEPNAQPVAGDTALPPPPAPADAPPPPPPPAP